MRSRLARVGVVAAGILALLGVMTPPAHATLVFSIAFVGQAQVAGPGLGYPCTTDGPNPVNVDPNYLCVDSILTGTLTTTLPLPHTPENLIPNGHIHFNHNEHGVSLQNIVACAGAGVSVLKLHAADLGSCTLSGGGTVEGHCGLSGGQVAGTVTVAATVGDLPQTFTYDVHFNGVASILVVTGHVHNANTGQNGLLVGVVNAIPPNPVTAPGQSCLNLTANTFTIVGTAAGYTRSLP